MTALRLLVAPSGRLTRWSLTAVAVCLIAWTAALVAVVIEIVDSGEPLSMSYWVMDVVSAFIYGAAVLVMLPRSRHFAAWDAAHPRGVLRRAAASPRCSAPTSASRGRFLSRAAPALVRTGILEKRRYQEEPERFEYR